MQRGLNIPNTSMYLPLCRNGFGEVIGTISLDWKRGLEGTDWDPEIYKSICFNFSKYIWNEASAYTRH